MMMHFRRNSTELGEYGGGLGQPEGEMTRSTPWFLEEDGWNEETFWRNDSAQHARYVFQPEG